LLATLKQDDLRVLKLNAAGDSILSEEIFFNNEYGRLRDICVSPGGDIYFATSNQDGRGNNGFPVENDDRIIKVSNDRYSGPTGTGEYKKESRLQLYPNPVENTIYLDREGVHSYRIYDLSSRLVIQGQFEGNIDVSVLQPGLYILEVNEGSTIKKGKFFKR
jgi:hypothetical protein